MRLSRLFSRAVSKTRPVLAPRCKVPPWYRMFEQHKSHGGVYKREPSQASKSEAALEINQDGLVRSPDGPGRGWKMTVTFIGISFFKSGGRGRGGGAR